jgi:hypothetical protein
MVNAFVGEYAEGFAVDPESRDWYLLTKNYSFADAKTFSASLYRVPAPKPGAARLRPEKVREFPLQEWLPGASFLGQMPTDLAISKTGEVLILTYEEILIFGREALRPGSGRLPFQKLPITILPQQETAAFLPDGAVIYSSEAGKKPGNPPILKVPAAARRAAP